MITQKNLESLLKLNESLLPEIREKLMAIRMNPDPLLAQKPLEYVKTVLREEANVIEFPVPHDSYGGLVYYLNGRFYIHINTGQPKVYENFMWAHEYYHFLFDRDKLRDRNHHYMFTDGILDPDERLPHLFASEFLIDNHILQRKFAYNQKAFANESLALQIIRLIPTFEVPYKALVVKLAQEQLISIEQAKEVVDFSYRDFLPDDVSSSLLEPTRTILIDSFEQLLDAAKEGLHDDDLRAIQAQLASHLKKIKKWKEVCREGI
ncbi:ImmA/IrrE family metallo-endopeptidase [Brevibacillus agri]|uniref:ImmA/IrrE family metallo-endopeptidase n=1 Tax=Brevibacillus agri TaxID=51101 RepID=UPI003D21A5D4